MHSLSLLIKPTSGTCNLSCRYCFYYDVVENREISCYGMMNEKTLETIIEKALKEAEKTCTFAFQGGEPTLAGLEFYEKLICFQKKYNKNNIKIYNTLQTNGIIIDEKWAKFLFKHRFLVGISLDGPKNIHDLNRVDTDGKGTFTQVMNAISVLKKYNVDFNILYVVNGNVARYARSIYHFYKKNNFQYLQFMPCLDSIGENRHSLTPAQFKQFLIATFDLWYNDILRGENISIRYFDNLVRMLMGYPPEVCGMAGVCGIQYVIEADGSVYPCDFYVLDQWKIGNINEDTFYNMGNCKTAREFIKSSSYVDLKCRSCEWLRICRGGCRRNREPLIDGKPILNYLCQAYKGFFDYAMPKSQHLSRIFR